ncbi:MAG: hypothetical protein ABSD88_08905 [Candidatus Korobacteraceae bacterium]|jgi:hypothetical protein
MHRRFSLLILLIVLLLVGGIAHAQTRIVFDNASGLALTGSCLLALGATLKGRRRS